MKRSSPMVRAAHQGTTNSRHSSIVNEQLVILYQLEQRKVSKLENENRALRERINNLLSKEDDDRIVLLAADKTRRKLVQLKAITEKAIKSLESGLKEFHFFVEDINEAVGEQEVDGALEPTKANSLLNLATEKISKGFTQELKRIPESPMLPTRYNSIEESDDEETLTETDSSVEKVDQSPKVCDEVAKKEWKGEELATNSDLFNGTQRQNVENFLRNSQSEVKQEKDETIFSTVTVRRPSKSLTLTPRVFKESGENSSFASTHNIWARRPVETPLNSSRAAQIEYSHQALNRMRQEKRLPDSKANSYKLPSPTKKMRMQ